VNYEVVSGHYVGGGFPPVPEPTIPTLCSLSLDLLLYLKLSHFPARPLLKYKKKRRQKQKQTTLYDEERVFIIGKCNETVSWII